MLSIHFITLLIITLHGIRSFSEDRNATLHSPRSGRKRHPCIVHVVYNGKYAHFIKLPIDGRNTIQKPLSSVYHRADHHGLLHFSILLRIVLIIADHMRGGIIHWVTNIGTLLFMPHRYAYACYTDSSFITSRPWRTLLKMVVFQMNIISEVCISIFICMHCRRALHVALHFSCYTG